ncbi:hypothetical protein B7P43_G14723 [Cryptotermes secundus]|uniref:Integrase p58-like C-terminal domain-containing protein n=1 Tax=Cryptotermes secundus TaxID=105785 RepID=A0A2J7Q5H6_9NEOP|nr:hypothetical protein B7P43_G14723 [Cryptotermes secundus]
MAYRATPHCTVKYSPYYLVCDRNLRLPIEGDWRPQRQEEAGNKGDYDRRVSELSMRLYEAKREARKQSKSSHEVAKRYYDKRTRGVLLKKGDFVCLYNTIEKRGRAKKFEYKYQGPYMILGKISPLIYNLQIEEAKSIVVHVNRLKRANIGPKVNRKSLETEKPRLSKKDPSLSESKVTKESREEGKEIPPSKLTRCRGSSCMFRQGFKSSGGVRRVCFVQLHTYVITPIIIDGFAVDC